MTSRERVKRAIHFQGVDHMPHFLPDGKENDILWLWTPREPARQPWAVGGDGLEHHTDAWGTTWTRPPGETNHGEKTGLAIPDVTRQAAYVFPDQHNLLGLYRMFVAYSTPETIHYTPEKIAAMCAAFREYEPCA